MTGRQENNLKYLHLIDNKIKGQSKYIQDFPKYLNDMTVASRYTYVGYVVKFMETVGKKETDLRGIDFLSYMSDIQFSNNGQETTSSYRISIYSALKRFSEYLYSIEKVIPEDYMKNIKKPKKKEMQKTIEKRNQSYLNEEELKEYIWNVHNGINGNKTKTNGRWRKRDSAIITLFLTTGMRCSALMKLDMDDIDLKERTITVTDKGEKVQKYSMTEDTVKTINEWLSCRNEMFSNSNAVFITKYRDRMTTNAIADVTKKYAFFINGKEISPHKLRGTYGTMLYRKTHDLYFVQKSLNHSSPVPTQAYIRDEDDKTMEIAADIMGNLVSR